MEEQMTRIENLNQRIDKIIAKDEEDDYRSCFIQSSSRPKTF